MRRRRIAIAILALTAAAAGAADKPGTNLGNRPIEITADRLDADSANESVDFTGNVGAVQGEVTLQADRLHAEYSKKTRAIEKITADGNVRVTQGDRKARAAKAVFYNIDQKIELSGGAELVQGENDLKGEKVTIYLRENRTEVRGGEGAQRIKAVIYPQKIDTGKGTEGR